jgi:hypothetical protein
MVLCFRCKKSLIKKYVKVKRRKTNIVIDVEDMSTMNGQLLVNLDVVLC